MNGPIAQDALLSLALPRRSALRPSKSRRLTSLPSVAPTAFPALFTASTISGSGLFHSERGWMPMSAPRPTADIGCDLVKISASGPMPTSRYCDQAPAAISTSFRRAASGEPGRIADRFSPMTATIDLRTTSAFAGSPRACSSITRSSMLDTNVTPAALIAARSQGARSHGLVDIATVGRRVGEHIGERGDARQRFGCANIACRIVALEELARRRRDARQIVDAVARDAYQCRSFRIGQPDTADQQRTIVIVGQASGQRQPVTHRFHEFLPSRENRSRL